MCGTLGLGVTREQDLEGLRRMHKQLRAGGLLALDCEVNEFDFDHWRASGPPPADDSPPAKRERRLGADGFHYALRGRVTSLDLDSSCATREVQAWQWKGDDLVAHETHVLTANIYSSDEIVHLLAEADFVDMQVVSGYHGGEPDGHEEFLVYFATAP